MIHSLRKSLIEAFSSNDAHERAQALRLKPLIIFGPQSSLGLMHLKKLLSKGANFILAVDDFCQDKEIQGIPVCNSRKFLKIAPSMRDVVALDFSQTPYTQALYKQLAIEANIPMRDLLEVLAAYDAPSVYEPVPIYRERTRARADDWLKLSEMLADDMSRATLYSILLQRLEYNRNWLKEIMIGGRDEYFGQSSDSNTFTMGKKEHFVDAGAHRGTVISKLLGVTGWEYASIHAFEPDRGNFTALQHLSPFPLERFFVHNCAVSNKQETLRFSETGTMGSHVSDAGGVTVPCVKLDDTVEQATFIKMDVEGFETKAIEGAATLIATQRPRLAIASYHYAPDLLDIVAKLQSIAPDYHLYLRHHFGYFYDTILYATPRNDWQPLSHAE
ncbi:MAG: FkbM family methyltransferase [Methylotenera sp.]|uniref:FkbM family methyltransferase n=1 Tax=Methylotenera sp. TaxID=2051956 RepID=UPI000D447A12|nr:FkbM family methyltransferase [Methylotenera sp.]PPC81865.1 MAG: FkbM family methyltransferase [Methylotenera sp.]